MGYKFLSKVILNKLLIQITIYFLLILTFEIDKKSVNKKVAHWKITRIYLRKLVILVDKFFKCISISYIMNLNKKIIS